MLGLSIGRNNPEFKSMPNYDYVCLECENVFEVFQSMKDPHLKRCPDKECKGKVKRKLGTGAGIIFKGSGFYETDYRSESYKKSAAADKKAGSEATKSSSTTEKKKGKSSS